MLSTCLSPYRLLRALLLVVAVCSRPATAQSDAARALVDSFSVAMIARDSGTVHRLMDSGFRFAILQGDAAASNFLRMVAGGALAPTTPIVFDSLRTTDGGAVAFVQYPRPTGVKHVEVELGRTRRLVELRGLFSMGPPPVGAGGAASGASFGTYTDTALRDRLVAMRADDQRYRASIMSLIQSSAPATQVDSLFDLQRPLDERNAATLRQIVGATGWPRLSQVGMDAATTAFLILQHASPELQMELLPLLERSAAAGEAVPSQVATLVDRVLVHQGKKQRYGSQLRTPAGKPAELPPIEDPEHVEERRQAVGLPPLAEYLARFGVKWPPSAP